MDIARRRGVLTIAANDWLASEKPCQSLAGPLYYVKFMPSVALLYT